ncbi:MAG: chromate transporter [Bryobacterales bacterium]|nr:chromate transporter [Bryobacterales bacterium]MBV9399248.1 chromate transporter [Bryobacterales bacterium]
MNILVLYLLLLKASVMSFSGLGSLPIIRNDFVVNRHLLTDRQVNTAVVAGRTGPGPFGLYLVCVGYYISGVPGAAVAFLAMVTPAFLVLPLMHWLGRRADDPHIKNAIQGVLLGGAGLLLAASVPLAKDAITGPFTLAIVIASFAILSFTKLESVWLMLGAAVVGLLAKFFGPV